MGREYGEYLRRGATVAGVAIDSPAQNAAMVEKLALPFPILSDPDGAGATKPLGVWDGEGRMAKPAILVFAPDGTAAYRYVGVDFTDRPGNDGVLAALDALGLPPIDARVGPLARLPVAPGPHATKLADLGASMRGVRFAAQALAGRTRDPVDKAEAERTSWMAERYVTAQGATLRAADRQ